MSVAGIFPAVAGDLVGAPDSASREHDRFRAENFEPAAFPFVTKCANRAIPFFQDRQDRVFHEHLDALMHAMILQRANHFESGAIPDVREPRITVTAEVSLK